MASIDIDAKPASTEAPPVYTEHSEPTDLTNDHDKAPPPSYALPTAFTIGAQCTPPLVTPASIKGHLSLLHAFAQLRKSIEELDDPGQQPFEPFPTDKDIRWTWFVAFAVDRFATWCENLEIRGAKKSRSEGDVLPPLDVLMVWHSYMLNPGWYSEDCARVPKLRVLSQLGKEFANTLPRIQSILSEPSKDRVSFWGQITHRSFDPLQDAKEVKFKQIRCPACTRKSDWPYMNDTGTGYLQQKFEMTCPNSECSQVFTHSTLGARKLAEDLATPATENDLSSYLAGTVRTNTQLVDDDRAQRIKVTIQTSLLIIPSPPLSQSETIKYILSKHKYSLNRLKITLSSRIRTGGGPLVGRIMSAYTNSEMFSIDLVGAVIRQGSFVEKMHSLKWTDPGYFDDPLDEIALQHCLARYHAFLDLMSSSPAAFFVPTLDIDLAWHTHQLLGSNYNYDCKKLVGRYVDHDDKVEEDTLATSFDLTCRAWKNRFGVQYMHCGCPVPGETIGQRLSRFVSSNGPKSYLVPPSSNEDDHSVLAATHPSDHNAVFDNHTKSLSDTRRDKRREKRRKRLLRDQELVNKGKMDKKALDRGHAHDPAFLLPIPLWYYTPVPVGCAAFAGGIVDSAAGGGIGSCAAGVNAGVGRGSACASGGGCGGGGGGCAGGGGGGCGGGGGGGCGGGGGGGN